MKISTINALVFYKLYFQNYLKLIFIIDFVSLGRCKMLSHTHTLCFALASTFALSGCVPLPHFVSTSPRLVGKVVQSSKPLQNASIFVNLGNQSCKASSTVVKTSEDGSFVLNGQSVFRLFYVPMVEPLRVNKWEMCVEHENITVLGIRDINFQSDNQKLVLFCDLDKPNSYHSANDESIQAFCKVIESVKE